MDPTTQVEKARELFEMYRFLITYQKDIVSMILTLSTGLFIGIGYCLRSKDLNRFSIFLAFLGFLISSISLIPAFRARQLLISTLDLGDVDKSWWLGELFGKYKAGPFVGNVIFYIIGAMVFVWIIAFVILCYRRGRD